MQKKEKRVVHYIQVVVAKTVRCSAGCRALGLAY